MAFAMPGTSKEGQQPQEGQQDQEESPPHLLRSGHRFRGFQAFKNFRRADADVLLERSGSFESAYSYLKEIGFLPYESPM